MAENPAIQMRAAQMNTPAPEAGRRPLARSKSAAQGGSERIRSPEETAAMNVGRAIGAHMKLSMALLNCPAWMRGEAEIARTAVCTELLSCVGDMETLQRAGKQPKLVMRALDIINANQKRLDGAREVDPKLMARARALLGHVEARDFVEHLVTTTDLDDEQRRPLLAHALGEVSLLLEMDKDDELASAALDTVMVLGFEGRVARPRDKRAALAATIMAGPRAVVQIRREIADEARENLVSLVGRIIAISGSGKRSERERGQAVTDLAEAYHDIVVLDAALGQGMGKETDRSLIRLALEKVIERPPTNAKMAAAGLMMARMDH